MNFPDATPYTRIIEHAHFGDQHLGATTVTYEYPEPYQNRVYNEPYYPLPQPESHQRYARYAAAAAELRGKVVFSGRLAEYRYYDMDQAVAHALTVFRNDIAPGVHGPTRRRDLGGAVHEDPARGLGVPAAVDGVRARGLRPHPGPGPGQGG